MLKIMVLRKRHEKMLEEAEQLRSKISGFKSREADVAAQVEAASTDEEIAAAAAAVEELEKAQKSAKERLATIIEEAEALQQEIADAEAAASSAASPCSIYSSAWQIPCGEASRAQAGWSIPAL